MGSRPQPVTRPGPLNGSKKLAGLRRYRAPGNAAGLPGDAASEPVFGLPALWIDRALREEAGLRGLTVVDASTVVTTHLTEVIKDNLAGRHMDYEGPEIEQGGPWGYRHQFNLADSGCGSRGPRVQNDRAGEVGRLLSAKYFDLGYFDKAKKN